MKIGIFIQSTKTDPTTIMPILYDMNNRENKMMSFGEALEALKLGLKVKRQPWGEEYLVLIEFGNQAKGDRKGGVVKIEDGDFKVVYSYIALNTPDVFLPWSATYIDLLEEDWILI